jgi:hypothetical protein
MLLFLALLVVAIASLVSSCATPPRERDELCDQLARFADAPSSVDRHPVRLKTDGGGVYFKYDDPGEQVIGAMFCEHGSDEPGKALCAYLLSTVRLSSQLSTIGACLNVSECTSREPAPLRMRASPRSPIPKSARSCSCLRDCGRVLVCY